MSKVVRKTLTECKPTARRKRELGKLSARPDGEIDLSDIPELTDRFWQNAVRNPFYRPIKKQITLRLDADVIAWLRRHGKGYQTKANSLLREMMMREVERAR
ncbi:MAG: BrnA antitoxin family protein [Acidobacteriia bacterium]|nr:BrnA antitoxin family protein [Terriglobia bacterium]